MTWFTRCAVVALIGCLSNSGWARGPALLGPPCLCHPFEIGSAESLPWGDSGEPFARESAYDLDRVVPDTIELLAESDDTLVHMETLRRAVVYLWDKRREQPWRVARCHELLDSLRASAQLASGDVGGGVDGPRAPSYALVAGDDEVASRARKRGLYAFDLAFAHAAFRQAGILSEQGDTARWLRLAHDLRGGDGALHLGSAMVAFDADRSLREAKWVHLDKALRLADDRDSLLSRNLVSVGAHFYEADTRERLEAEVARHVDRD